MEEYTQEKRITLHFWQNENLLFPIYDSSFFV